MENNDLYKQGFTQNRELSWLKFNDRVLSEAEDETVPLLERLKFVSIFTSNLDEFFMIRVGSLFDLSCVKNVTADNKSGMTPKEQLEKIYKAVQPLYAKRERIYSDIERHLRAFNICDIAVSELDGEDLKYIKNYYKNNIAPVLSPQIIDGHHPFPHLQNKVIHAAALLKQKNKEVFGVIPIPASLPDIVFLPGEGARYVRLEEIVLSYMPAVFSMYETIEKTLLCITRNADITSEDEAFDINTDFRKKMQKLLIERKRLSAVRLELSSNICDHFMEYLTNKISVSDDQVYVLKSPMKMGYVYSLENKLTDESKKTLTYHPFTPQKSREVNPNESMIKQVLKKDILLSYPYESMEPFLRLVKEAANDKYVVSIKITIYRLASKAKLVEYLCTAAENGIDVTVFIELRARFDEQNNIDWSERLEDAGCRIIYGFEEYKVHSKICLIMRKDRNNAIKCITQIGTGNYNEKTAQMYTDISIMTSSEHIGSDAQEFFKNMAIGNLEGHYRHLIVSPISLKSEVINCINEEILKGQEGYVLLKLNSITDVDVMEKLKQASCAGVKIQMIIRGICCIVPGLKDKTENISVISVVGRFLEHSRVYCFGKGKEQKMYISSADFMTRNTERRVEVAAPVYDNRIKQRINFILDATLKDNVKARVLRSDKMYEKKDIYDGIKIDCQQLLIDDAEKHAGFQPVTEEKSLFKRIFGFLSGN